MERPSYIFAYSMITCLLDYLDNISQSSHKDIACGLPFLDLHKTMDTAIHRNDCKMTQTFKEVR